MPDPDFSSATPAPDPQYVREISGRRFVLYAGVLDLAERMGLTSLEVEILQYPAENNNNTCVCKATAKSTAGKLASDIGEASAATLDPRVSAFLFSMASTRAKARALRNLCGVGITCLEELGSFTDVISEGEDKASGMETTQAQGDVQGKAPHLVQKPVTVAQLRAIRSIAKRKKLGDEDLVKLCHKESLDALSCREASKLIDQLKRAA